jgi:hypothetical protein
METLATNRYDPPVARTLFGTWRGCPMDKVLVAKIGVEGGGLSIYGRDDEGSWSFWTGGSSWGLDDDDDEVVRSWSSEPVPDLGLVVPPDWPLFRALEIHPDFIAWFRGHYEGARASLSPEMKEMQAKYQHRHWDRLLGL